MKIRPLFAWYDMWIGAYYDRPNKKLYVCLLPCIGFVIDFKRPAKPPEPLTDAQKKELEQLRALGEKHGRQGKSKMWQNGSYLEGYIVGRRWRLRYSENENVRRY